MENPKANEIDHLTELLKILGDRTRLTLFSLLKVRELCVCELTELLEVSQPAISQHLRKLKLMNVVKERKQGQWVYYSLREPEQSNLMLKSIIEHLPDLTDWVESIDVGNTCSLPPKKVKTKPV